jgi:hypothetical protein
MSEKIFLTYTNATAVPYQGSVLVPVARHLKATRKREPGY